MKIRTSLVSIASTLCLLSLLSIISCSKENSGNATQEEQTSMVSSESDAEAETVFNDVFDDAMGVNDEVGMSGTGIFGRTSLDGTIGGTGTERPNTCFTVTITHATTNPFPIRVVIDFGTAGCTGPDGHTRRGKIIIEYSNRLIIPGATASTRFDGFYFDSIHVEGTHRITNTSTVGNPLSRQFTAEVTGGKLTRPNGDYTEWASTKVITQTEGLLTPDLPRDDVFKITGSAHGRRLHGTLLVGWESNVIEPLIKRFTCRWFVKGTIRTVRTSSTANSPWVAVLNFGTGNCDNQATITINGVEHQITLH